MTSISRFNYAAHSGQPPSLLLAVAVTNPYGEKKEYRVPLSFIEAGAIHSATFGAFRVFVGKL